MAIERKSKALLETIPADLLSIKKHVYEPIGLLVRNIKMENESAEYQAAEFTVDNLHFKFRKGKITPTKIGQFVTFWKRHGKGPISPFSDDDPFDLLIVSVRSENHFGQFVFPKKVLCEKGIVSTSKKEGKRAMRVYPPWDRADNPQAKRTQAWQLNWFMEVKELSKNHQPPLAEAMLAV